MKEVRLERSCTPVPGVKQIFPSPHHPHDVPPIRAAAPHFFCSTQRRFLRPFASRLRQGGRATKSDRILRISGRRIQLPGNSAQAGNRQAASSGRKFPPSGKPPGQDRRKSPLKKYGRRKERSHEWPVHSPFPFAAGTCPGREECAEQVSAGKRLPPGEKPVAEHAAAQEAPEKKSPQAPDLLPKRAEREAAQEKTAEYRWRKPFSARRAEKLPEARTRLREKTGYGKGS